MNQPKNAFLWLFVLMLFLSACGGSEEGSTAEEHPSPQPTQQAGLSQQELERGIGPVKEVNLSATIEEDLARQGEEIFRMKCTACHKMDQRYVGPPLGDVLEKRTPEYVMNMILNPDEMVKQHPEAKKMLAEYLTPMPNQNLTEQEARAVLEYLRTQQTEAGATESGTAAGER